MYLATHSARGFRTGDRIIHAGTNKNQRGRTGKVYDVRALKVLVCWDDEGRCACPKAYSVEFARENFGVELNSFKSNSGNFAGGCYVRKYYSYQFGRADLAKSTNHMFTHTQMKNWVSSMEADEDILQADEPVETKPPMVAISASTHLVVAVGSSKKELINALETKAAECNLTGEFYIMKPTKKVSIKPVKQYSLGLEDI